MGPKSPDEYITTVRCMKPKVFINGTRIEDILQHPVTKTVVDTISKIYGLTCDPEYEDTMTTTSHLTGERISRCNSVCHSNEDLQKRLEMAIFTSQKTGTCNYRCPGCDALTALASVTYEMDHEMATDYNQKFLNYLKYVQEKDLACSGALTDVKGDRGRRPLDQDPDMYLRIVEKRSDGIIVRGAKINQSGAYASNETIVLPTMTFRKGEEDYALAFAVPNGVEGLTYITQYTPFSAERIIAEDICELGNPIYGVRETCMMVFDDVFVPSERIFMCGEVEFTQNIVSRFASMHRMNCGGACKVGFADLMIGSAQTMAEYLGIQRAEHVRDKITDMIKVSETVHACAIAAAVKGKEEPEGSGVYIPDFVFGNIAKLNIADGFWELMSLVGDVSGGFPVTMPSCRELGNSETEGYVKKYLKAATSAEKRMRMAKFIQNWVAGLHGVGTWHGAGSPQTQKMMIYANTDLEEKKRLAKNLARIEENP